jgi:hypothetical protein
MPVLSLIELLAIRLGCQRTPAKSLVMSKWPAIEDVLGSRPWLELSGN